MQLENTTGLFVTRGVSRSAGVSGMLVSFYTAFANPSPSLSIAGQYWGEMGYFRIAMGKNLLGIESEIAWATPGQFTVENFPCSEDGKNCNTHIYQDPSNNVEAVQRRMLADKMRQ